MRETRAAEGNDGGGFKSGRGSKREEQKVETWQRKSFRERRKYLGKFFTSGEQTLFIFE